MKRSQRADDLALQQRFYEVVIAEAKRVQEKPERSLIKESTVMIAHLQAVIEHPNVATSLDNLAVLYKFQGRYREAESLYLRALEIDQRCYGDDHPEIAIVLNNLAALYRSQERYTEAELFFLKAVSIVQQQLSADHPYLARYLHNLAGVYDQQGRYREAESFYLQALPIFSTKLEANHPWMQEGSQNFRALLQKAIQEQRTDG